MARPRKPTSLKILEGAQPCRINRDEPKPPPFSDDCPEHLGDVGREAWIRISRRLEEMGVLTQADAEAVALYASTYELWRLASDQLADEGLTMMTALGTQKPHALLATIKECRSQMTRLLTQFGMTPSSRSSLHVQAKDEEDEVLAFVQAPNRSKA